jgi:RimJ/RimL family protein N-acetyltransferase
VSVTVEPARVEWLEALVVSDDELTARFGIPVAAGWVGFPEALPHALDGARAHDLDPWGTHLIFEDGTLVGFGGFKGAPVDGVVELGYAVAPERRGRGIATAATRAMVERADEAGVVVVIAHTLAEENASTAVLRRSGFQQTDTVHDPDEGDVWRWERHLRDP